MNRTEIVTVPFIDQRFLDLLLDGQLVEVANFIESKIELVDTPEKAARAALELARKKADYFEIVEGARSIMLDGESKLWAVEVSIVLDRNED